MFLNAPLRSIECPVLSSSKTFKGAHSHFKLRTALSRPDQPSLQDLHWQARVPTDRTSLQSRTVLYADLQSMPSNVFFLVFEPFRDFERNPGILHVLSR